ncbi:2 4-dienoyl-CoA reductase mitochondrial [Paragonimus heterotremus]|uniref:2 4-dienoyl-CoA reductase mitochondrial n=1 Tax=Paragonimus heterotremus TaxID=100268 RepID=A0A8J4WHX1_9TREM|nr:2 4-dienoyl-CoA reductase mitochondrial [Paragonimus heterotremus]
MSIPRIVQLFRSRFTPVLINRALASTFGTKDHFEPNNSAMFRRGTFAGRTAFITGGGTGLGKRIAQMLCTLGANVFIVSRKEDVLKATCEELRDCTGIKHSLSYFPADVRHPEAVQQALETCEKRFGLPDLIVNNAAGNFICPTEKLSPNAFGTIVDIVLKGAANVTLQTAKALIAVGKGGTYLAISAVYAQTGSAFVVPSAAAKAGVEAMTKSLAAEWGRFGLRFNAIAPGPIHTEGASSRLDPTGQLKAKLSSRIPAKRLGTTQELANLAMYLLSDYSSWMNGEIVRFDGGELPAISGEFNALLELFTPDDWDVIERLVRDRQRST